MSFDKIAALYVFCMDYHSGQSSRLYRILSRISTRYRPNLRDAHIAAIRNGSREEWAEAHSLYRTLEDRYGEDRR